MTKKTPYITLLISGKISDPSRLLPPPEKLRLLNDENSAKKKSKKQTAPLFYTKAIHRARKHDLL